MNRTPWTTLILIAALLGPALIGGCSNDDGPTDPGGGDPTVEGVGTISGVVHRTGGLPQSGALVVAGDISTTTNEEGYFVLSQVPEGEVLVEFTASGRAPTYRVVSVSEGSSIHLPDVVLVSIYVGSFEASEGGTITSPDGGSIEIAPATLTSGGGSVYDGTVYGYLTVRQPQSGDFYGAFPGRYEGLREDQSEAVFESFGLMHVELKTSGGSVLSLLSGATANLRLTVTGDWAATAPATIPTWIFDPETGRWLEDGLAALTGNVYTAVVTHLSIWNWGRPIDDMCSVSGFVDNDAGQPAVGVRVISRGVNHRFVDEVRTNADGRYTVQAVKNSLTDLWAASGSLVGDPLRVSVGDECPEEATEPLVVTVPAYSVALTWGAEPADLDSHLLIPMTWDAAYDYYHIAYYNLGTLDGYPYAQLDTDDTDSYGPEIITGTRVFPGRFQYWVHDFTGDDTPALAASGAQVQLELGGALYLFEVADVPLEGADPDGWWHVFDIEVGGASISVESVMRFEPEVSGAGVYEGGPGKGDAK